MLIRCGVFLLLCCSSYSSPEPPDNERTSKMVPGSEANTTTDECGWDSIFDTFGSTEDSTIHAYFGEFRWMIAIFKYRKENPNIWYFDDYIGGGTIIHESVVMTAAHKVINEKAEELKCRAGEWDIQTLTEVLPFQERMAQTIVTHPNFFIVSVHNDVALLILRERFDLASAPHIGIACLMKQAPPPSTSCYTMGWGKFNMKENYSPILKKLPVSLVSKENCQNSLRKSRLGSYFVLHESLICAVGDKNSCYSDIGSPLVCSIGVDDERTRYAVVGMVAYGIGCVEGRPGVYVNIPNVYSWISKTMKDNNNGTTSFEYSGTKDDKLII